MKPVELKKSENPEEFEQSITFRIGDNTYGIPLLSLKKVIGSSPIKEKKYSFSDKICGEATLDGNAIPVIDSALCLGLNKIDVNRYAPIITRDMHAKCGFFEVGFLVTSVDNVIKYRKKDIQDIKDGLSLNRQYISGALAVEGREVLFLNLKTLVSSSEIEEFYEASLSNFYA